MSRKKAFVDMMKTFSGSSCNTKICLSLSLVISWKFRSLGKFEIIILLVDNKLIKIFFDFAKQCNESCKKIIFFIQVFNIGFDHKKFIIHEDIMLVCMSN